MAISVEGMTCNDCAEKLARTLKSIPGTHNVRVNFIRGQADFGIEPSLASVDNILAPARTATGFVLIKQGGGEILNLLVSGPAARALSESVIDGLTHIVVLNKSTVQVEYDPTTIGARELLEKIGDLSTGLAPPGVDPAVSGGRRKFQKLLLMTALSTLLTIPVVVLAWGEGLVSEFTRTNASFVLGQPRPSSRSSLILVKRSTPTVNVKTLQHPMKCKKGEMPSPNVVAAQVTHF